MSDLPQPLTPSDCDLRGSEWMPLYGQRLFDSDFEARATDLEFRVAMRLWWAAWQQVPAASLPDDNAILCKLAGLGRDMKTWMRLRAGLALYGFSLCSDGRFYHRRLSEHAVKAYELRLKTQTHREQDRERLRRWRAGRNGSALPPHETQDETRVTPPTETRFETHIETRDSPVSKRVEERKGKESSSGASPPHRAREVTPEDGGKLREKKWLRTYLPADWQPSAKALAYAESLGFDADWMANEANGMRNWAEMASVVHDDWDKRFLRRMDVAAYATRQARAAAEPRSVYDTIREQLGGKSFLIPGSMEPEELPHLTAIAGGKS